ncbi:MAG: D-glycero-beta-D-manno-heptose-7-phosphate kinase [Acidobacteria bacterium]|nr:D-glycero-beta-D-manno-heptose-7-phosphate kinase [Acidobacteriota bacterium]
MSAILAAPRAKDLVRKMTGCRLLVVGDLMVDRFLWGSVHRISPEAPVPVVHLNSETSALGGAGNVGRNLQALGATVALVGVVGQDRGSEELRRLLKEAELDDRGVIELPGRITTVKSRVIAHQQQVVRIDRESQEALSNESTQKVCDRALEFLAGAQAVVISDYDKGVVTPGLLGLLLPASRKARLIVAIDPKPPNYKYYTPATVITPNLQEARTMLGSKSHTNQEILEIGLKLRETLQCEAVLLTRGEEGMILFQKSGDPLRIPSYAREVYDVTGAGDTVISVLTLALTAGASLLEASSLANLAAGLVVGKLGTAVVTPEELIVASERSG